MDPNKTYANLYIRRSVYNSFKDTCDELGMKYNRQVEIMMQKFIEEHEDK